VVQIGHDHFKQVVGFTGNHVARNDLRQGDDGLFKRDRLIVRVPLNVHAHEDCEPETDLVPTQHRAIPLDVSVLLQPIDPSQARRRGQTDTLGKIGVRESTIRLQCGYNPPIDSVEVQFWHLLPPRPCLAASSAKPCVSNGEDRKDMPAGMMQDCGVSQIRR
jgi:hypothetical protein